MGGGDPFGMGYIRFEELGGGYHMACEGEGILRGGGTENRATGVQFWLTQCGGWCSWVMGTHLGWGKPGFGSWAHVIKWLARGG